MAYLKIRQAVCWFRANLKGCAAVEIENFHLGPRHSLCFKPRDDVQNIHTRRFISYRPSQHIDKIFLKSHLECGVKSTSRTISITKVLLNTSNVIDESGLKKEIEALSDQFMEAREMMEDARESKGTVYFSEDVEEAQTAVKETLNSYQQLLAKISESQKQQVMRTIGLKMEELKAQLNAMEEDLKEDH